MLSSTPHEINYYKWCPKCEYYNKTDETSEEKCDECLNEPSGIDTRRPRMYKKKG